MKKLRIVMLLAEKMGVSWLLFRARLLLKIRLGCFERSCPARPWEYFMSEKFFAVAPGASDFKKTFGASDKKLEALRAFYAANSSARDAALKDADEILRGVFTFYSWDKKESGLFPDWHLNPYTGERAADGVHWSRIGAFDGGDIKNVWELSRFSWAFALARGASAAEEGLAEQFARRFWSLLENWMLRNPPNVGANWMCGQEAAMRLLVVLFSSGVFIALGRFQDDDLRRLGGFVSASVLRIGANLDYALSQKNNHGISECAGLVAGALAMPGFRRGEKYFRRGMEALKAQVGELFYSDGSFSQYSANYHRVALDGLLLVCAALEASGREIPEFLTGALSRSLGFFDAVTDSESGAVPRYGSNDGARLIQLSDSRYWDFRPMQNAVCALLGRHTRFEGPALSEEGLWLFGRLPSFESASPQDLRAEAAGYYTLRNGDFLLFFRCGRHFHRMGHEDMLSAWISFRSHELAADAGTFSYNSPAPFGGAFSLARYHNCVTADGLDYSRKITRFLSLPWTSGRILSRSEDGGRTEILCRSDAYEGVENPVILRRKFVMLPDAVAVLDSAECSVERAYRLHWLLDAQNACRLEENSARLETPSGEVNFCVCADADFDMNIFRGGESSADGWISDFYNGKRPCFGAEIISRAPCVKFCSVFSAQKASVRLVSGAFECEVGGRAFSLVI